MACIHGKQWVILLALILTFLIAFFIGVVVGYLVVPAEVAKGVGGKGGKEGPCLPGAPDRLVKDADKNIAEKLLREFKAENLEENLRRLTAKAHLAGTPADYGQAEELRRLWLDQGLDHVKLSRYRVLLSYPDPQKPNKIELLDAQDKVVHQSQLVEKIVRPEQNQSDVVPPFNAYSAPGITQGELVYVNYGRIEDFIWLNETKKINFTDKILIARYGKIFRGSKLQNAQKYGAKGLILYSDPADYAVARKVSPYPDSWWLPGSGVQRGSLAILGDPLTPGYPANDAAYRIPLEEVKGLPTIPVHPIGYDDAAEFLKSMSGEEAPLAWRGRLPITYRLGPGFTNNKWKVKMSISTRNKMADTYNVFGYIKGDVEPDRYVMIGNHRDAWVFGAADPSSGTAVMMEISRGMGTLLKQGWRPRRTIVFCSWGAEEFGLVGSREYVEEYGKTLEKRVVAYLNMDTAVEGNFTFRGKVLPLLKTAMFNTAKKIPNPDPAEVSAGRKSVYDTWLMRTPQKTHDGRTLNVPKLSYLGSGSDYDPFILRLGVTCVDIRYSFDPGFKILDYPLYHSVYETFHLMKTFIDPEFKYHLAVTQFSAELARSLSDSLILPFDLMEYAKSLRDFAGAIERGYGSIMRSNGVYLDNLNAAITNFTRAVEAFEDRVKKVNKNNPYELRLINDQMVQVERAFINPLGLPDRPLSRHIVFAPSKHNAYAGSSFPGLVDAMFGIEKASDAAKRWIVVKKQLSLVVFTIQSAVTSLADTINF